MNSSKIKSMQKAYGFAKLQNMINTGDVWKMEGSFARGAMRSLEAGMCMLPKEPRADYYGNRIPSRDELQKGSKGTYQNCAKFWQGVEDGVIFLEVEEEGVI